MANQFESMFETLGQINVGPSKDDYKKQMEDAQRTSKVNLKSYQVETFVLNNKEHAVQYRQLMFELIEGIGKRTHVIFKIEREFVPTHPDGPTWMVYLEWGQFELVETIITPVPETNKTEVINDFEQNSAANPLGA